MKDTLSTLDLHEKPGQKITMLQNVRHGQRDGPAEGERAFSAGPHHGHYSYVKETPVLSGFEASTPRLETDSAARKEYPVFSGVVRYFPDALAEIARLSFEGNKKHNPGEPLHWSRGKSTDQLDCLVRHLSEAGTLDTDGLYHDVKIAWRALANLQVLLEKVRGLPISPGSRE